MTPQQTASQTKTAINSLCASKEKRPGQKLTVLQLLKETPCNYETSSQLNGLQHDEAP